MKEKKHPPHLPKKIVSLRDMEQWFLVKWVLLMVAVGLFAGVAAALSVSAWILPAPSSDVLFVRGAGAGGSGSRPEMDSATVRTVRYRLLSIYDSGKSARVWQTEDSLLAHALVLSSDGWAVAYYPAYRTGKERLWSVADHTNTLYDIKKTVYDPMTGLLFFRFDISDVRVSSFARSEDIAEGAVLWAVDGSWKAAAVGISERVSGELSYPYEEYSRYDLDGSLALGDILVNDRGDFAGFVDADGRLLPAWWVQYQLPHILETGSEFEPKIPWRGFFVNARHTDGARYERLGFYVSRLDRIVKNGPRIGDVVVAIGGDPVQKDFFYRQILSASGGVTMKVVRGEEEIEVGIE